MLADFRGLKKHGIACQAVAFRRRPPLPALGRWTSCVKCARSILLHGLQTFRHVFHCFKISSAVEVKAMFVDMSPHACGEMCIMEFFFSQIILYNKYVTYHIIYHICHMYFNFLKTTKRLNCNDETTRNCLTYGCKRFQMDIGESCE